MNCCCRYVIISHVSILRTLSFSTPISNIPGMVRHSNNPKICKAALEALCNICMNVGAEEVLEITSSDLEALVFVMRAHQTLKPIQERAITLLRGFSFSRTNVLVLEQNLFIVPLVRSAMSNFNDEFQGRADELLRVLPYFS